MAKERRDESRFFGFFDMSNGDGLPQAPKSRGVFIYPNSEQFMKFMAARKCSVNGLLFRDAAELDKHNALYEQHKAQHNDESDSHFNVAK